MVRRQREAAGQEVARAINLGAVDLEAFHHVESRYVECVLDSEIQQQAVTRL